MYVNVHGSAGSQVIQTRSTWPFHVPPALPSHCLCWFHCAVKLNRCFSSSPGQTSFLGVWSDTTNFVLFTDASSYRWAGVLNANAVPRCASDYWSGEILSSDIAVKEALALSNALSSFALTIKDSRVDVYVDSSALFHACRTC